MSYSAHIDTFTGDSLPHPELQPEFLFDLPELQFPSRLNCAWPLLDRHVSEGRGDRQCILAQGQCWTYADLQKNANRIANVLVNELSLVPGNRVLLRSPNNPLMAACWFAVMKAGGVAVATMPLLRAKELRHVIAKAKISHALCDLRCAEELDLAAADSPELRHVRYFNAPGADGLEAGMSRQSDDFINIDTSSSDTCVLAFTSGTTGQPKATMHFHRDIMAACKCWPRYVLQATSDDRFIGTPPLAFTFGLGGLLLFPLNIGASTVLIEQSAPQDMIDAIRRYEASILFTAPTSYRAMAANPNIEGLRDSTLRKCVSAGEVLPSATREVWRRATGIELIDGIGATEMMHIFISADEYEARSGATGKVVPGYVACVMGNDDRPLPPGEVGQLAVKGPTGCRYLSDERQTSYVRNGWNYTGDAYRMDGDGYFYYHSRTDDMIISAGYNIAGVEIEEALLRHSKVAECGVVGVPDDERGQIVKAFVVLQPGNPPSSEMARELQDHVKQAIAPYKYPRAIEFVEQLPRTETGKLRRYRLRDAHGTASGVS